MDNYSDFIECLLMDMIKNHMVLSNTVSDDTPSSIIFVGETGFYFAKKEFGLELKTSYGDTLQNKSIEMVFTQPCLFLFIKVLQNYGEVSDMKTNLSMNKNLKGIYSFSLKLGINSFDFIPNFHNFLISYITKKLGNNLEINFVIYVCKKDRDYDMIERCFVKECIVAEYISELELFCISSQATKQYKKDDLSLRDIAVQSQLKKSSFEIIDYDRDIALEPDRIIAMVADNKDMRNYEILDFNEQQFEPDICSICQEEVTLGFKTKCGHVYHCSCLEDFLKTYYTELVDSVNNKKNHIVQYDVNGNIIKGANYTWSCPNCKNPCFKLELEGTKITNPEACIYKI